MAYNVPFTLSPSGPTPSFDPNNRTPDSLNNTGIGIDQNNYVPGCGPNDLLVKDNYRGLVDNYTQNFGMKISYWSTGFSVTNQNKLYGEDPTAKYRGPRSLKAIIDFTSYSSFITRFGMMSDLDIVIYIPIKAFQAVWGNVYPLNGDLFSIDDSACDRPLGQTPMVFEVTEKHDSVDTVDFMGGHYVWKLTARRYDNSYEPNAPQEAEIGGPIDNKEYGKIESSIEPTNIIKNPSAYDVDEEAKKNFDNPNTAVFGKYY